MIGNFPRVSVAFCQQSYSFEWGGGCSWVCWWCGRRESAGLSQSRLPNSTPECGSATHVGAVQPISTPHFPSSTDPPAPGDPLAEIYPDTLRKAEISRSTQTRKSFNPHHVGRPPEFLKFCTPRAATKNREFCTFFADFGLENARVREFFHKEITI